MRVSEALTSSAVDLPVCDEVEDEMFGELQEDGACGIRVEFMRIMPSASKNGIYVQ